MNYFEFYYLDSKYFAYFVYKRSEARMFRKLIKK